MLGKERNGPGDASARPGRQADAGSADGVMEREAIAARLRSIKRKILVLSGKGGVGKSTVAVNLAVALADAGKRVGLLDVDIHGPSIPKLLGLEGRPIVSSGASLLPAEFDGRLKVMSIGFLLQGRDDAVIWRGPLKMGVIKQFLKDVEWGELDYLIIDCPPGTGDEPLSVAQLIGNADGALIVTTPQELALSDVRRCVNFCRKLNLPISGVLENMSGFVCPHCGTRADIFKTGGGEAMAREMNVPFLGRIPIDPDIVEASDAGTPYVRDRPGSEAAKAFRKAIEPIIALDAEPAVAADVSKGNPGPDERFKIAVPVAAGQVSMHFGHCEEFALFEVDKADKRILSEQASTAPPHQPGLLPGWLHERGVKLVIAGGMGSRAKEIFAQQGIDVITGAPAEAPENVVRDYLNRTLQTGDNVCDH